MGRGYGIVFQESTLFPWYRVFENCLLPFRIAKSRLPEEQQVSRIESLLEMVDHGPKILVLLSQGTLRRDAAKSGHREGPCPRSSPCS